MSKGPWDVVRMWVWRPGGQPGPHLLAEKVEAIGMAKVLPRVEHLKQARKSRDHARLYPPVPTSALPGPAWKASLEKVVHVEGVVWG